MHKVKVSKVEITWSENSYWQRVYNRRSNFRRWAEANALLTTMARSCGPVGYDKTEFTVTFADGTSYQGRYDLHALKDEQENPNQRIDLGDHMRSQYEYYGGLRKPARYTDKQYSLMLSHLTPEQIAASAHAARTLDFESDPTPFASMPH